MYVGDIVEHYIPDGVFRFLSFFSKVSASKNIKELIGGICKNINSNDEGFEFVPKEILFSKITYGLPLPSWETSDSTLGTEH